jgi:uncharacterized delta-60 repeat protein
MDRPAGNTAKTDRAAGKAYRRKELSRQILHSLLVKRNRKFPPISLFVWYLVDELIHFDTLAIVLFFCSAIHAGIVLDPTFGTGGLEINDLIHNNSAEVVDAVQPDGKIVLAGTLTQAGRGKDIFAARLLSTGAADTSYGNGGYTITSLGAGDDIVKDMAIQSDGKVVLVGSTTVAVSAGFTDFLAVKKAKGY